MNKGKIARLAGFVGALGISGALVAMASSTTGAYFTDEVGGNLSGTSGVLDITASGQNINFTGLNPGSDKDQTINFRVKGNSTTSADVWLVFDKESPAYGQFTGVKTTSYGWYTGGGLGGYGHFKVTSAQGMSFESYNLQLQQDSAATNAYNNGTCHVHANGTGGDTHKATGPDNATQAAPECGVPAAIQIGSNIAAGTSSWAKVSFGLTGKATDQNKVMVDVPFKVVATQPGIRPDAANF
ncbi:hypothetical protein [Nakamurella lactea]|uniref:hypothetical protein n=1 Tax=Nakamurella lactea TaxID=459515 RepID=UPI00040D96AD|nr:hypothetical protein [Nakamurella lactea]